MAEPKLYTLTELSKKSGVSMPTLQRYKRLYQKRIPSVGSGRKQRYPAEAVAVVKELKVENLAKRGRPRKKASGKAAPKRRAAKRSVRKPKGRTARKAAPEKKLLSLAEIGRQTNISYPTLLRYVKTSLARMPHEGTGRKRRFYPEAVEVFRELRASSRRGRRKGSGKKTPTAAPNRRLEQRLKALEKSQKELARELRALVKHLKKPLKVTVGR